MKRRFFLTVLLIFALVLVLAGCAKKGESQTVLTRDPGIIEEIEPNDTEETAQLIVAGDTVNGSFSTEDDIDFYRFVLTETGIFTAWTESDIDIYTLDIIFLDDDGAWDDYISGEYINIEDYEGDKKVEAILYPGTYLLELEGYDEGNYVLKTEFEKLD